MTFDSNTISLADFMEIEVTTSTKATPDTKIGHEYRNFMATPEEIEIHNYGEPHWKDDPNHNVCIGKVRQIKNVVNKGEILERYPPLKST